MGESCSKQPTVERVINGSPEAADAHQKLLDLLDRRPYLGRKVHPLHFRVDQCRICIEQNNILDAEAHLARIESAIKADARGLHAAFNKFDLDQSGGLETEEFKHFITYVGFQEDMVKAVQEQHDRDHNGIITLDEFEDFVGRMGGIATLFETRREAVAKSSDKGATSVPVGARVRAYRYEDGRKSDAIWDARVLEVSAMGDLVKLQFTTVEVLRSRSKISTSKSSKSEQATGMVQEVPKEWIAEDVDVIQALSGIGILDDAQHYWTILLPSSEQYVIKTLAKRQSQAIFGVRQQAMLNHNAALLKLLERGASIGITNLQIWSILTWVRDLAPIIVHIDIDAVLPFLEEDTHYRNQFETSTSKGLLCLPKREEWERNLFGTCYDDAPAFERPKYGVLDVMNDNRGVLCARDYGDSYFVLKNARLRCTFSPVDSGGISGNRLAVLDQYAHVLMEFSDDELREVSRVANAREGSSDRIGDSSKLDGFNYKEAQIHGEIDLTKHVKRLVVHPRHLVDGEPETRIRKLCHKHGWEFQWMHEERKRRIFEERQSQSSAMLEMSWANEEVVTLPTAFVRAGTGYNNNNNNAKASSS